MRLPRRFAPRNDQGTAVPDKEACLRALARRQQSRWAFDEAQYPHFRNTSLGFTPSLGRQFHLLAPFFLSYAQPLYPIRVCAESKKLKPAQGSHTRSTPPGIFIVSSEVSSEASPVASSEAPDTPLVACSLRKLHDLYDFFIREKRPWSRLILPLGEKGKAYHPGLRRFSARFIIGLSVSLFWSPARKKSGREIRLNIPVTMSTEGRWVATRDGCRRPAPSEPNGKQPLYFRLPQS
jgi:hypothetical protein